MATLEAHGPMSCPAEEQILKLVSGELSAIDLEQILAHSELCADCSFIIGRAGLACSESAGDAAAPRPAMVFRAGQLVGERYRIEGSLGRGGMGEVYVAVDSELGERVALKTIKMDLASHPGAIERFKREIRIARRITHPHVCRVLEFGRHEDPDGTNQYFFTMEYVRGQSLRQRLARSGVLPEREVARLGQCLAAGLQAIHEQGVIHRDIKTENVHLRPTPNGELHPMLLDFGVARAFDDDAPDSTRRGVLAGTPEYMAPEQLRGQRATPVTDIYALGLVLFEALTGRLPFPAVSSFDQASARHKALPPSPSSLTPGISERMDALVTQCLHPEPAARPQDAGSVELRMRELLGHGAATGDGSELGSVRRQPLRSRWSIGLMAGTLALSTAAAALALSIGTRRSVQSMADTVTTSQATPASASPLNAAPPLSHALAGAEQGWPVQRASSVPEARETSPRNADSPARLAEAPPKAEIIRRKATPRVTSRGELDEAAADPGPCSPPYHYTADGIRVYRSECLTEGAQTLR